MTELVNCVKLKQALPALAQAPVPGEIGQRIHAHISQQAWQLWLQHQTMLINEYRLSLIDPKARQFLFEEMQKFLFADGSEKPPGYIAKDSTST